MSRSILVSCCHCVARSLAFCLPLLGQCRWGWRCLCAGALCVLGPALYIASFWPLEAKLVYLRFCSCGPGDPRLLVWSSTVNCVPRLRIQSHCSCQVWPLAPSNVCVFCFECLAHLSLHLCVRGWCTLTHPCSALLASSIQRRVDP